MTTDASTTRRPLLARWVRRAGHKGLSIRWRALLVRPVSAFASRTSKENKEKP